MLDLPTEQGLLLVQLDESSPLAEAGARGAQQESVVGNQRVYVGGDILQAINDTPVTSLDDMGTLLEDNFHVGDTVSVQLLRDGNEISMDVELAEEPN
jgi:S1-C subfamily serine protease